MRKSPRRSLFECSLHLLQLGRTSNGARFDAFESTRGITKRARFHTVHCKNVDRLALALDVDRLKGCDVEYASHMQMGIIGDQDSTDGGSSFEPAGKIDCITDRGVFANRSHGSQKGWTRINTDP